MKKIIALLMAAIMLFAVSGCSGEPKFPKISYEYTYNNDEYNTYYMTLTATGRDGEVMWEYVSPDCFVGQCETIQYLGIRNGLVYINENAIYANKILGESVRVSGSRLRALNADDGTVVWDNTAFNGIGASAAFDNRGNIYVAGYFGPDCIKIDKNGNTVWQVPYVDDSLYWVCGLSYEKGVITISYEMNEYLESDYAKLDSDGNLIEEEE